MHRLTPPSGGAKKPASIGSPDPAQKDNHVPSAPAQNAPAESPPLLLFKLAPPPFAVDLPPLPGDPASEAANPSSPYPSTLYRNVSRKAMHLLRSYLQGIGHQEIWLLTVDTEGNISGGSCLAKGGLEHVQIALPDFLVRARTLGAKGILLLQNRMGTLDEITPIDAELSLHVDLLCTLLGLPLIEHIYIDRVGKPFFVRERGLLTTTAPLVQAIRERIRDASATIRESGITKEARIERWAGRPAASATVAPEEEPRVYRHRKSPAKT